MDFTISALAAERVADLRRDLPDPASIHIGRPQWTRPFRHPFGTRRKAGRDWTPRPA